MGRTSLVLGIIAIVFGTLTFVDGGQRYVVRVVTVLVGSLSSLLLINTAILYVYLKYFVSNKRVQDTFKPPRFTRPSILAGLLEARAREKQTQTKQITQDAAIDEELNALLALVLRDFVQSWFQTIAKDISFPVSVERVMRQALGKVSQRLSQTDLVPLIQRAVPRVAAHLSDFRSAEISLRGKDLERSVTESDELDLLLASRFRSGRLHPALTTSASSTRATETAYLRAWIDRVLPLVLDQSEIASGAFRVVIREILTGSVLQPILDMLADPDFWNQTIESLLGKAILEQEMVQKLREVLNRHASHDLGLEPEDEVLHFLGKEGDFFQDSKARQVDRRKFQEFLRMIGEEKNLLDLKRLRNDVDTELGMKSELVLDRDPEEVVDGVRIDALKAYIVNMEMARKKIDKRIATLSGEVFNFKKSTTQLFSRTKKPAPHAQPGYTLHDILTNTAGLSYFMEFMDRRRDMVKLQFWLMVEGLKNSVDDPATLLKDVKMIHETYFAPNAPHKLVLSDSLLADFAHTVEAYTDADFPDLKQKLYRIQQHVFWQIEKEHFPHFKRSDLYFKFLSAVPREDLSPDRRSLDDRALYRDSDSGPKRKRKHSHNHHRTLSDSTPTPFLSIAGILDDNDDDDDDDDCWTTQPDQSVSSADENWTRPVHHSLPRPPIRKNSSLDALQAELSSIVKEPSTSVLLLHAKNVKSTKALPVQQIHTLPSWTSSGGTNAISQIEHNNLEPVNPRQHTTDTLNVHYAPPGDLMLEGKIEGIVQEIDLLKAHGDTVDAMIKTAHDHNREEELRILKKSKNVFRQELAQLEYQKDQYEQQMSENTLSSRSRVNISNATIGQDTHGEFALYVIEIQQLGFDGHFVSGWIVARRYSEFFALHQKLKETFALKTVEFPAKWPLLKLQKPFLEARRASLERYLKGLLDDPAIRKSQELRAFLSQQNIFVPGPANLAQTPSVKNLQKSIEHLQTTKKNSFISQIYKTVAANLDDILVGPTLLDMITQRLSEQVTSDLSSAQTESPDAKTDTRLTESLCDLFIDMFELKDKTNWLRRQAIIILIQQILEGTIERKLKETISYLTSHPMILYYISKLTQSLWPEGHLAHKEPRKAEDKQQTKEEANRNLSRWLPDLLGNMVGRQNARKGARRLFTVLQNKRLNQDLIYTLFDEFIHALFPELEKDGLK